MAESTNGNRQFNLSQACHALFVSLVAASSFLGSLSLPADALVRPHTLHLQNLRIAEHGGKKTTNYGKLPHRPAYASRFAGNKKHLTAKQLKQLKLATAQRVQAAKAIPPQNSTDDLVSENVAPGVVHRYCRT